MAKRAAELHFAETKTVAETVRGAGEFFQFCTAFGVQQIELFTAVSKATEADSEKPDFSFYISMNAEELLKHGKNVGIEPRWFAQSFGTRVRFETGVTNRQRERLRGEASFAETLASLLRKMTQHRGKSVHVAGIFAKRVIVRDGFRLGVDDKFVGIAAARLAIERRSPLPENAFQFFLRHGRDLLDGFNAEGA